MSTVNNPQTIKEAGQKVSTMLADIDDLKSQIDDLAEKTSDVTGVAKADLNKLFKIYYKNSLTKDKAKANELFDLYEAVFD